MRLRCRLGFHDWSNVYINSWLFLSRCRCCLKSRIVN